MTSGKQLTDEEVYAIQRLASYVDGDNQWTWSFEAIATELRIDPRTVSHYVRVGNRRWFELARWKRDLASWS